MYRSAAEGASRATEKVERILQENNVKIDKNKLQEDQSWLMQFGTKYNTIWYWEVAKYVPLGGRRIASRNYFELYIVNRKAPSLGGVMTKVLYIVVNS